MFNPNLKSLLNIWPQIVAGYHKSCDHYWQFVGELNVLTEETNWYLKHDGYCHSSLEFGPFAYYEALQEWDGEELKQKMLEICHDAGEVCNWSGYDKVPWTIGRRRGGQLSMTIVNTNKNVRPITKEKESPPNSWPLTK